MVVDLKQGAQNRRGWDHLSTFQKPLYYISRKYLLIIWNRLQHYFFNSKSLSCMDLDLLFRIYEGMSRKVICTLTFQFMSCLNHEYSGLLKLFYQVNHPSQVCLIYCGFYFQTILGAIFASDSLCFFLVEPYKLHVIKFLS